MPNRDVVELVPPDLNCEALSNAKVISESKSRLLLHDDICPACHANKIIYRPWRGDYICGWCHEVFKMMSNRMYWLGNQLFMD